MTPLDFTNPRDAARAFTPKLTALVDSPLYDQVWEDPDLAKRDRSLATVSVLVAMGRFEELPSHLRRAVANGVTHTELSALITHLAFYAGFPAAVTASAIANATLEPAEKANPERHLVDLTAIQVIERAGDGGCDSEARSRRFGIRSTAGSSWTSSAHESRRATCSLLTGADQARHQPVGHAFELTAT